MRPPVDYARIEAALAEHGHGLLYLSGGKDSLTTLHVMAPYLDRLTVMWMDSGDAPRETVRMMEGIAARVPRFLRVEGKQTEVVAEHGFPVDVLPAMCTPLGRVLAPDAPLLQSRYECCARVLWNPLHAAAEASGITLLIRGQKLHDPIRPNYGDGTRAGAFEVLNPLEHWTDQDVFDFARENDIELPVMYDYTGSNIDCRTCTAYTDELTRAAYLREHEPEAFAEYSARMHEIARWVGPKVTAFGEELVRIIE